LSASVTKSGMQSLDGLWQPLYAELDGAEAPQEVLQQTEVELSGGKYTVRFGGIASDCGTFSITAGKLRSELNLVGTEGTNAGKTIPCLFKFLDDTLMICYGLGGERPKSFSTAAGSQRYLVTYARK
jgi:uncharacterized protein (TIGR03067 family)